MSLSQMDHGWLWDKLDAYLARHSLRQTNQRKDIVNALISMREKHVDAEKLHNAVKDLGLDIGLATIYRTLGLLREAGIVEQRSFTDGRAIFELAIPDEHHDHLICIDCGIVKEFENEEIEALQLKIANSLGFSLSSHKLELYARCLREPCPNRVR